MPYLDPFSENWTEKEARHLLKRTSFGVTESMVTKSVSLGLTETINTLFIEEELPNPPLKHSLDDEVIDADVKYGETWVNALPYTSASSKEERTKILNSRKKSLYAWSFLQMQNSEISIREKLTLFWHNHFVAVNTNPHREYSYIKTIRTNSLGNFKELTKQITVNTSMLLYLSGSSNTETAPNENYSRELLELFTIGKGVAVGNGDYTNYTESDVVELAKALTGWRVKGLNNADTLTSYFSNSKHAKGDKKLSHRFKNTIITENGENEYKDVIDIIFEQEECSRFIIRKFYRWFINSDISNEIETNIIEPLAQIIRDNNYNISPALKVLLSSEHFYENVFCMIKSPIDLIYSATKSLSVIAPKSSIKEEYEFAYILHLIAEDMEQSYFNLPNVAGWKAYYQQPLFYKTWANSYLLPKRLDFCRILVTGGKLLVDKKKYEIAPLVPVLDITDRMTFANDPNFLITELSNQFFNYPIAQNQINSLKEILIPGLPDFEWTVQYTNYINNKTDEAVKKSVENKLRNLISVMIQMSEFQIV